MLDRLIVGRRSDRVILQQHSPPPPLCRLPAELLLLIAETLKTGDLQQLLRVCRTMRPIAEVHLYHHLVIPVVHRRRISQLLRTLRDRPDLAEVVLSFKGYLIPNFRAPKLSRRGFGRMAWLVRRLRREKFIKEQTVSNFASLLDAVLNSVKNLRELSIYDLELSMPSESAGLLRNLAQKVSLTDLEIGHPGDGLYSLVQHEEVQVAHEILLFLRQQPLLQHLTLSRNHQSLAGQQLLPSDIPSLRSLYAVPSDIAEIVPGRPVTTLNVCEINDEPAIELWAKLHTSTASISQITFHIFHKDQLDRNLKRMAEHLTELQSLTLIGVREDKDYAVTVANVRLITSLRDLTVELLYPCGYPSFYVWDDLHASCPNVERVSIIRERVYHPSYVSNNGSDFFSFGGSTSTSSITLPSPANPLMSGLVIPQQQNPPPPLYQLPRELLLVICETLESGDLQQLLRVCRTMRSVAEVHLYQHIIIPWAQRHRIVQLLETLRDRPDLASLVLSFKGYLIPKFREPNMSRRGLGRMTWFVQRLRGGKSVKEQMISNFGSLLDEALGNMNNLHHLVAFDLELSMLSESVLFLRNAAPRLSLTYLEIGHSNDYIYSIGRHQEVRVAHEILLFLRHQPLLEHLRLSNNHESLAEQELLLSDIPSLQSLYGVPSDIMKIIPGRPIATLSVCDKYNEPAIGLWARLHMSTAPISTITLHIIQIDQLKRNLRAMAEHLTQLQSLTLIGVREDKDYAVISENVRFFASLRDLTVDLLCLNGFSEFYVWNNLHASCPNVERVSIIREHVYYPSHVSNNGLDYSFEASTSTSSITLPSLTSSLMMSGSEI
ncbi:hypothetical protein FRB94_010204 [Tulasnella sp. JGI-2019a]|nr:hypothetical protein FRB94_010204 [Tulasnella sp. JGI-2019a]